MALREELKQQGDFLFRYRSYFPIVLLLAGLALMVLSELKGGAGSVSGYQQWMAGPAIFVSLFGLLIRIHAVAYSGRHTSGRNTGKGQVAGMLNTKGLYSLVRNPLYVGNYFMWLGISMLTANLWFVGIFTLIFWIYYERIVYAEEEFLRDKFGADYLKWAAETPIFFPKKLKWEKPDAPFHWRKVIKQEKNGFLALFLVFFLFELLRTRIRDEQWAMDKTWLLVMVIFSAVSYLAVKLLKKKF